MIEWCHNEQVRARTSSGFGPYSTEITAQLADDGGLGNGSVILTLTV